MLYIKYEYLSLSVNLSGSMLTPKEKEVVRLLLAGFEMMAIARMKQRSVKTVSAQKLSAYKKLGVNTDVTLYPDLIKKWGMKVSNRSEEPLQ
ncbi:MULTISPECIES: LuxR C-terminal-related transcriptional regulator [Enterobacteriaceae]|uniref:LuxR C-terminal-related transcriptional regulator n=1 Tax=Enterobacteriaceae TaxID=543 RepID=UPI00067CADBF|nr:MULTISPECIES: LuxR C-terminal-related transcriptional regulator [Enterobacteriaceae]EHR6806602.1 helix-turn-helix transcriptional regulator [Salmonella enterica]HAL5940620.1 helix-turn-helix transcriptional regulator [Escherichia coli]